ncbi:unnamed protein product [Nesidiocoris tenuis]|uniref:Uncharacterized protein n=1 Tax=Nesidiocoris tenuis TaxID=355587 RepID=A0A6H5HUN8_9HEMI|nr:unnamed protein product [Nesidiocoris tenuis]
MKCSSFQPMRKTNEYLQMIFEIGATRIKKFLKNLFFIAHFAELSVPRQRLTIIADENRIPLTVSAYLCPFQVQTVPPPSAWAIYIEDSDLVKAYIIITILFQYRFRLGPYEEIPGEGMSLKNRKKRASSEVGHPHGTGKMGPPAPTRD